MESYKNKLTFGCPLIYQQDIPWETCVDWIVKNGFYVPEGAEKL